MGDVSLKVIRVWRQTHYHKWKKKQHEMSSRKSRPTKAKGVAVPEEKSSANFLFVEVAPSGKSLADKELRTSIQKHVMRDIGRARKTKNCYGHSKLDVRILSTNHKHDDSKSEQRHFMLSRGISGTGRMDPFTNYPIEMTLEILFLLDHGSTPSQMTAWLELIGIDLILQFTHAHTHTSYRFETPGSLLV